MEISVISPIYKSDENDIFKNYRPIAVLPCFSKILERLLYTRLMSYLNKHDILYENQYGFRTSLFQALCQLRIEKAGDEWGLVVKKERPDPARC